MILLPKDYPFDIGAMGATLLSEDRMGFAALNRTIRSAATIIKNIGTAR